MVLRDLIGDVLRTLWAHKLRTFLTMFGIAWGIVSIVLMVAAGEGLRKGQEEQAQTLGKDLMIVFRGRTSLQAGGARAGRAMRWLDSDMPAIQSESPDCQDAIPELEQNDLKVHSYYNNAAFTVTGSLSSVRFHPKSERRLRTFLRLAGSTTIQTGRIFGDRCIEAAFSWPRSGRTKRLSE